MADSLNLITAQIHVLDTKLALIHIPIQYYSFFLHPILRLLFGDDHDEYADDIPWTNRHDFLNISIMPNEISIICARSLADRFVVPVDAALKNYCSPGTDLYPSEISRDDYIVVQVDGQGLEASQRVLELTGPLAMAGISIFFITTYFSDYILVPSRAKRTVILTLEQRGFVFSKEEDAFVSQLSPTLQRSQHANDSWLAGSHWSPKDPNLGPTSAPSTPPAKDIDELQSRTFRKLRQHRIRPQSDPLLRLVSCAGSREPDLEMEARLKDDLLQVLLSTSFGSATPTETSHGENGSDGQPAGTNSQSANFLSITITSAEPIAILLEERLLPRLGSSLFGAKAAADILVPILLDLRKLGFETTGIVGGVASRLSTKSKQLGSGEGDVSPTSEAVPGADIEVNFLSTAKSGAIIVKASQLDRALQQLEAGYAETNGCDK